MIKKTIDKSNYKILFNKINFKQKNLYFPIKQIPFKKIHVDNKVKKVQKKINKHYNIQDKHLKKHKI